MAHSHHPTPRAYAGEPTLSLLRLSLAQRAAGALAIVALLWMCVMALIGRGS